MKTVAMSEFVWVQYVVSQAMLGVLTPDVLAVSLLELADKWQLKFYLLREMSEEKLDELGEIAGDAESLMEDLMLDEVRGGPSASKPIGYEFILDTDQKQLHRDKAPGGSCTFLFLWDQEAAANMLL